MLLYINCLYNAVLVDESLLVDTVELSEFSSLNELDLATISLPASISNVTAADDINLAFTLYTQSTLFPIRDSIPDTVVGSSVISASVDGIADGTTLSDNVTVNLRIVVEVSSIEYCDMIMIIFYRMPQIFDVFIGILLQQVDNYYYSINFLNFIDGRGNWSIDGCTTTVDPDTNDIVTCSCNHLTNFACLVVRGSNNCNIFKKSLIGYFI